MAVIERRKRDDGKASFRAKVRLKGHPPASATFERLTDARNWAQQTEAAIREGRYFKSVEAKKHTLGDLIDRYIESVLPTKPKSEKKQKSQLLWWKAQLGDYLLIDVTPPLIATARDKLLAEQTARKKLRSTSTTSRYLAALSHAFTVAEQEWHWVEANPVSRIKKPKQPKGRERFLSDPERASLLKTCKQSGNVYLYAIVVLAISTGMRYSEILGLRRSNVDLKNERIVVTDTKNNESRSVPLVGHAREEIERLLKVSHLKTDFLFPAFDKKGKASPVDIRSAWNVARARAELKDFRFHDLRHTAASYLAMNGASLPELATILGHKTYQMVRRYTHLTPAHTKLVVQKMNQNVFG
jgi:integrase